MRQFTQSILDWASRVLLPVGAVTLGTLTPFESCQWLALAVFVPLALVLKRSGPLSGFLARWAFGAMAWSADPRPVICPVSCAVSVALWPPFIQIADLGGEYLVLFCLLWLNWLLADALAHLSRGRGARAAFRTAAAAALLAVIMGYGNLRLSRYHDAGRRLPSERTLSVASLQPNVPVRWGVPDAQFKDHASDEEICLRQLAANLDRIRGADLLVLPELPRLDYREKEFKASGFEAALQRLSLPVLLPSDEFFYADDQDEVHVSTDGLRSMTRRRILAKYSAVFFLPGVPR